MYKMMTPGPTQVHEDVLLARSRPFPNPDMDEGFVAFYEETCKRLTRLLGGTADHETLILGGEGMLALEAAIASITEPGDRVLVLSNGEFGAGFADLVKLYGGLPLEYSTDPRRPIDPMALQIYLENNHKFKYATLVHCDTPSGRLNDMAGLCRVLKSYGILTVVDAVASSFGQAVDVKWGADILCTATQKALSAPPGLCFVTLSPGGFAAIKKRNEPIKSYYANLLNYASYRQEGWFPYTMPASDILSLGVALDRLEADKEALQRHDLIARACRAAIEKSGLELYGDGGFANTVTAFLVPEGVTDKEVIDTMRSDYNILIANSFGVFAGKLLRIGHMGESCTKEAVAETLDALGKTLEKLGVTLEKPPVEIFLRRV